MRLLLIILLVASTQSFSQEKMPKITIKDLKNKPIHIVNDFNETDKIYVFSFWATWCAPCISELEAISEHYQDWSKELNMELIAVSTDDSRTQRRVRPLLNGKNWPYRVLMDTNQKLKRALSIVNIPYMVVVKNQKIELIFNGYSQGAEDELYQSLKAL